MDTNEIPTGRKPRKLLVNLVAGLVATGLAIASVVLIVTSAVPSQKKTSTPEPSPTQSFSLTKGGAEAGPILDRLGIVLPEEFEEPRIRFEPETYKQTSDSTGTMNMVITDKKRKEHDFLVELTKKKNQWTITGLAD